MGQGLVADRLPRVIASGAARQAIPDTVMLRARTSKDMGALPAGAKVNAVHVRFNLTEAQEQALNQLMAAQLNPASSLYHQWITPEQYAASFGLSDADIATVTAWLEAQGLTVIEVARSHTFVTVTGTAAQMNRAFGISLHQLSSDGETHYANLSDPTLPAAVAGVVKSVTGLSDFAPRPRSHATTVTPKFTSSVSGSHYFAPGDYNTIYDTTPLLNGSFNGTGETIAVMGQTDISLPDVLAFRTASGLSTTNLPTVQVTHADPGLKTTDLLEAQLDVEWSGAIAPNAKILYVNSDNVLEYSLTNAIANNLAPIITISYGNCEAAYGNANLAAFNQLFRQANVQGQTIIGPGGDSGASDCDSTGSLYAYGGLSVDFPASSPYVTGIGGLQFNEAGGLYWGATNNTNGGSALSYIPEQVWNDSFTDSGSGGIGGLSAGGGGASLYFPKPAYQAGSGVPADLVRDVPDISFNASANPIHDPYLVCYSSSCTNGFRNAAGNLNVVGGTSAPTPSFAGALALIEQKLGATTGLGNINPVIYALANSTYATSVFHDTRAGSNLSPCVTGSLNCGSSNSEGYSAVAGYDLASGWGSVDISNMANDWNLVTPLGVTPTTGLNGSIVNFAISAAAVPVGTAISIPITVSSSVTGTVTAATGTVSLLVDNVPVGSSVTLANGSANTTLTTSTLTTGIHTISAVYSGDAFYAGSIGYTYLNLVAATAPDFALSPANTAFASVAASSGGTSGGVTLTITPYNGFTGTVTLSANANGQGLAFTPVFTPATVQISGTTAATSVLTIKAYTAALDRLPNLTPHRNPAAPWEYAGSGVTVAGLLLLSLPRRNRRFTLVAVAFLSAGLLTVAGCSQGGSATGGTTTTTAPTQTNAVAGQYGVTVTATATTSSGTISHSTLIILNVK